MAVLLRPRLAIAQANDRLAIPISLDLSTDTKYSLAALSITSLVHSNAVIPDPINLKFQRKIGLSHMYEVVQPDFRLTPLGRVNRKSVLLYLRAEVYAVFIFDC